MDDEEILRRGGDEHDIAAIARANGADLTRADFEPHELFRELNTLAEEMDTHLGQTTHGWANQIRQIIKRYE